MMSSRFNRHGKRFHTPEDRISHWRQRREAELDSSFIVPVSFLVVARDEPNFTDNKIIIESLENRRKSSEDGQKFSIDWLLKDYTGSDQSLRVSVSSLIHVFGSSPFGRGRQEVPPQRDLIFLNGEAEVSLVGQEDTVVKLGRVVGLTIMTSQNEYPVWLPEAS